LTRWWWYVPCNQGILRYLKLRFAVVITGLTTLAKQPESDLWLERWNRGQGA